MNITRFALWGLALSIFQTVSVSLAAQNGTASGRLDLGWVLGPQRVTLGSIATLKVPQGCAFLGKNDTQTLLRALHNPTRGDEIGLIAPETPGWLVVVRALNIGHVQDPEEVEVNPVGLLDGLRDQNDLFNRQRQEAGLPSVTIQGWKSLPVVDEAAHSVEWAVDALSNGRQVVNRCISVLGRTGVIQLFLIDEREDRGALQLFKRLGGAVHFAEGQSYGDFQPGDALAIDGMRALLVGELVKPEQKPQFHRSNHARILLWFKLFLAAVVLVAAGFLLALAVGRWRFGPQPLLSFSARKGASPRPQEVHRRANFEFYYDLTRDLYHW